MSTEETNPKFNIILNNVQGVVIGDHAHVDQHIFTTPLASGYTPLSLPIDPTQIPVPGNLPPGSRIPFPRNALFTGRETDLGELAYNIFYKADSSKAVVSGRGTAYGMGGIGKTQLAIELAYRYGRFTNGVHWLYTGQATKIDDLYSDIAVCGERMNLVNWPNKLQQQVNATLHAWNAQPRHLIILDNLQNPALLPELLSQLGNVYLLITTRRADIPLELGLYSHRLGVFRREESLAYLRQTLNQKVLATDFELSMLASALGDLPLALHIAIAYLNLRPTLSIADYLKSIEKSNNVFCLPHPPINQTYPSPTAHEQSLYATFKLSWDCLNSSDPSDFDAGLLFRSAGYCASNVIIPKEVFAGLLEKMPSVEGEIHLPNPIAFLSATRDGEDHVFSERTDFAIARLDALGLGESSLDGITLHPLLAELAVSLDQSADKSLLPMLGFILSKLASVANANGLLDKFRLLLPHFMQVAETLRQVQPVHAAALLNSIGLYLKTAGDLTAARPYYEEALSIRRVVLGEQNSATSETLINIGALLRAMGDLIGARQYYEQAANICRTVHGENHPDTAFCLNNLGAIVYALGDFPAARLYFEQTLIVQRVILGEQHRDVAISLNNLGMVYHAMGDLTTARVYSEQAIAIQQVVLGENHLHTVSSMNNLGMLLKEMGDTSNARQYLEQALAIRRSVLGEQHPATARSLNNLGLLLRDIGDTSNARQALEQALVIRRTVLGEQHPDTAQSLNDLGLLLQQVGETSNAHQYLEQALVIRRTVLGEQHPDTAQSLNNLGLLLKADGDYTNARTYLAQALAIFGGTLPPNHPNIYTLKMHLSDLPII